MKDDPAIRNIRDARHRISEECGHDPKRLVAYYMERQRQRQERATASAKDEAVQSKQKA